MRWIILATVMGLVGQGALAEEVRTLRKVDFELPMGIEAQLPADVPAGDVYVSDDFCFYYKYDGAFYFLDCVG